MKKIPIAILCLLIGCKQKPAETVAEKKGFTLNFPALADKLMEKINLQPGERVLLVGKPGRFDSIVGLLSERITKAGGVYLGTANVDTTSAKSWNTDFTKSLEGKTKEELVPVLAASVDLGIMLPGAFPTHPPYGALQEVLKQGKARTLHFHWIGAFDLQGKDLPIDSSVDKMYQRAVLETDYGHLAEIQGAAETSMRKDWIRVTTPSGTSIRFKIGDRPFTRQDGDVSMTRAQKGRNLIDREVELPAGAIRVAPLEETVEGVIAFLDEQWGDQDVAGLTMTFKKGKAIDIKATNGAGVVKKILDKAGEGAHYLREIAIGFNPLLAVPADQPWIPYYGYGAGVVRLSLGDNEELGGKVRGGWAHLNLFTDATVIAGQDTLVVNGKLRHP